MAPTNPIDRAETKPPLRRYTPAEYLAFERSSPEKHEYFNGEIFAVAGASKEHVRVSTNILGRLFAQLEGQPYSSESGAIIAPSWVKSQRRTPNLRSASARPGVFC